MDQINTAAESDSNSDSSLAALLQSLRDLISNDSIILLRAIDKVQLRTCWEVGRHIVEFKQNDANAALCEDELLKTLATVLTPDYGREFDELNLRHMCGFFKIFPNWSGIRTELSWSDYRILVHVKDESIRNFYMNDAADQNWLSEILDLKSAWRIFECIVGSKDPAPVEEDANRSIH